MHTCVPYTLYFKCMKAFVSDTQLRGELAEQIAVQYLKQQNYTIIDQNFTVSGGEVDIIAIKDNVMYFFEVKSVQVPINTVSCETAINQTNYDSYNPIENVTQSKIKRIQTAINAFHMKRGNANQYLIKIIGVWYDTKSKIAKVQLFDL